MATTRAMEVGVGVDSAAVGAMSKAERAQHEKHIWTTNDLNPEHFKQKIFALEKEGKLDASVFNAPWFLEVKQKANSGRDARRKQKKKDRKESDQREGDQKDQRDQRKCY